VKLPGKCVRMSAEGDNINSILRTRKVYLLVDTPRAFQCYLVDRLFNPNTLKNNTMFFFLGTLVLFVIFKHSNIKTFVSICGTYLPCRIVS